MALRFNCVMTFSKRFRIPTPALPIGLILIVSDCSQMDMDGFKTNYSWFKLVSGWLPVVAGGSG